MVSKLTSFVTEAFEDHLNFLSVEVVLDGQILNGLPADVDFASELDIGGVSDQADGAVILKRDHLNSLPIVGARIQIDGIDSRIRLINVSAGNPLITIEYAGVTER